MIKSFLQKFLTYGLGNILQTALRFILLPLYLRFFEPDEYGVISVLLVVMSLLGLFISAGVMNGLVRLYYEVDDVKRKELVGTTWLWYLVIACFGGIILLTQAPLLSQLLFQQSGSEGPIRILGVVFVFSQLQNVPYNIFRLEKKAIPYVGFSLFRFLVDFAMKLCFIVYLQRGVQGYFESSAIACILTLGLMLPFSSKYVKLSFNISFFKQLFRLGSPYIFSGLAAWALEVSDRLLLVRFAGEAAVGIYSLAYSFANIFKILLATPISLLIDPFFFGYAAKRSTAETKALLRRMLIYYCLAGGTVYLAITLGSGELVRAFTTSLGTSEKYLEAAKLVPIITMAHLLYFATSSGSLAGLLAKKPEITSGTFVTAAVFNVGLNFLIIPTLGALGAAIDTLVAYFLLFVLLYRWMERIYPIGHDWKALARVLFYLAVAFAIGWQIKLDPPLVSLFIRVSVGFLVFASLALFSGNILTKSERTAFFAYLRNGRERLAMMWPRS